MLGTLGGRMSWAADINSSNQVVGGAWQPGGSVFNRDEHAFSWENGAMTALGTLGGWSVACAINDAGGNRIGLTYDLLPAPASGFDSPAVATRSTTWPASSRRTTRRSGR